MLASSQGSASVLSEPALRPTIERRIEAGLEAAFDDGSPSGQALRIRPFNLEGDLAHLLEIQRNGCSLNGGRHPWSRQDFQEEDVHIQVAEREGQIVGFLAWRVGTVAPVDPERLSYEILELAVHRRLDRKNILENLTQGLKSKVRPGQEITSVSLLLPADSEGEEIPQLLSGRFGFRDLSTVPLGSSRPRTLLFIGLTEAERKWLGPEIRQLSIEQSLAKLSQLPAPPMEDDLLRTPPPNTAQGPDSEPESPPEPGTPDVESLGSSPVELFDPNAAPSLTDNPADDDSPQEITLEPGTPGNGTGSLPTEELIEKLNAERALRVHIRWMIRRDMPEVLDIEHRSFESPWDEEDFIHVLRQGNCIGMVAEHEERVVAFMVYTMYKTHFRLENFAVHPDFRRSGVGQQMVAKLMSKLSPNRRNRILVDIRESNRAAQEFFSKMGFRAVGILRDHYEDTSEDAYRFKYRYRAPLDDTLGQNTASGLEEAALFQDAFWGETERENLTGQEELRALDTGV